MSLRRRTFVTAWALSVLRGATARARSITVRVRASKARGFVGDTIRYEVEVSGRDLPAVTQPDLPASFARDFDVQGPFVGRASQIVATGSRIHREETVTYTYEVVPLRPGTYDLAARVALPGGRTLVSNPLRLEVVGAAAAAAAAGMRGEDGFPRPTVPRGDVFVWAVVDREEVYVGEQVNFALDVYERNRFLSIQIRNLPTFKDFWTEELPEGSERVETVAGVRYRVHPGIRRALFPQRAGERVIGETEAVVGLRRVVRAPPVPVRVRPLPAEGRPPNFPSHNVGRYAIEAEVDRTEVEQGKPVTLTVTVRGKGNVRFVDPDPWPALTGARRYDPTTEVETRVDMDPDGRMVISGSRTYRFLVIPERPGILEVPPHAVTFFDPAAERYETAKSPPIRVTVTPAAGVSPGADEPPAARDEADAAAEGLAPVWQGDRLPRPQVRAPWLTPARWGIGMALPPAAAGTAVLAAVARDRLSGGPKARAAAKTRRIRRRRIERLSEIVVDERRFYAELAALLQELAVARAGGDAAGLPRSALRSRLAEAGVPGEELDEFEALMDACDAARFGGAASGSVEDRRKLAARARDLVLRGAFGRKVVR